jgi:hypothetical protein
MKKLITLTITSLTMICFARAERINLGDYFSIDVPNSWRVTESGHHLYEPGNYTIYSAESHSCGVMILVNNLPPEESGLISYEEFSMITEADYTWLSQYNQRIGWSLPVVRKITLDEIPVLLFRQKRDGISMLALNLWVADKHFRIVFVYTKDTVPVINKIMESIKRGTLPQQLVAPVDECLEAERFAGEEI